MKRILSSSTNSVSTNEYADPGFSQKVIHWQKRQGRHSLPWQNTRDAYRIWVSEIMLQQTQVAAVIGYYARFLERFPDVAALAAAPVSQVMESWSGLGYYSRARNLHRCAELVVSDHGGKFPRDPEVLVKLPGIGRSTAAAIAAFAHGARAAILDGNVKRVFCRYFGVEGFPGEKRIEDALWKRATALLPEHETDSGIESGIESYTQGLMDLGATVCTRAKPACTKCPLAEGCIAKSTDRVSEMPARRPRRAVPERSRVMLVVVCDDHVLLERRPPTGIWGGLLSLPEMAGDDLALSPLEPALRQYAERFGEPHAASALAGFSHGFTHFTLHVSPWLLTLRNRHAIAEDGERLNWYPADQMASAGLPAPVKKLLLTLQAQNDLLAVHQKTAPGISSCYPVHTVFK